MAQRITVFLDDDVIKKLRHMQANQIKDSNSTVSLSRVINETLKKQLK